MTSAQRIQNRGTFHVSQTALTSGNSHSDRQSGGEAYQSFQQADSLSFQRYQTAPGPRITPEDQMIAFFSKMLSLDIRVYTSLVVSILFSMLFHAVFEPFALVTLLTGSAFFFVWYVMSFFDFRRLAHNLSYIA